MALPLSAPSPQTLQRVYFHQDQGKQSINVFLVSHASPLMGISHFIIKVPIPELPHLFLNSNMNLWIYNEQTTIQKKIDAPW